jgi:hypothetical protein
VNPDLQNGDDEVRKCPAEALFQGTLKTGTLQYVSQADLGAMLSGG